MKKLIIFKELKLNITDTIKERMEVVCMEIFKVKNELKSDISKIVVSDQFWKHYVQYFVSEFYPPSTTADDFTKCGKMLYPEVDVYSYPEEKYVIMVVTPKGIGEISII